MARYRIVSHEALKQQMKAVARGDAPAPYDASHPSFNSIEALTRLLTSENRGLLATIRDYEPNSIAELAELTGRAASNLTRTLGKLEAAGLVNIETINRRRVPRASATKLRFEIDPYAMNDVVEVA